MLEGKINVPRGIWSRAFLTGIVTYTVFISTVVDAYNSSSLDRIFWHTDVTESELRVDCFTARLVWLWLRRSFAVVSQVMVRTIVLCFSFVLMWMFWILMMKHSVAAAMAQYSPPICYGESSGKSWNLVRPFSRPEGHGK